MPHTFTANSDKPGKMPTIAQPAGKIEAFFDAYSALDHPTPTALSLLSKDYNIIVVGPPLTAD